LRTTAHAENEVIATRWHKTNSFKFWDEPKL